MIVVFTGIRALHASSRADVERVTLEHAQQATEIRVGGALGADTVVLRALARERVLLDKTVVYVPWTVDEQPRDAAYCIRQTGVRVIELDLGKRDIRAELLKRNEVMLTTPKRADRLVAYWDGRRGGTGSTIERARRMKVNVELILVKGELPRGNNR